MDKKQIIELLKSLWDKIKKIVVNIFNFLQNLVDFFKSKIQKILRKHPNAEAISIKINENLESGNFSSYDLNLKKNGSIANVFYDKSTGKIIQDEDDDIQLVSYQNLDDKTKEAFGNKDMLVLN